MIENSTQGLTLLDADHDAEVVGTEHHVPALRRWAPGEDGRARRVAVELALAGDDARGRWIAVLLDGDPVGGLSPEAAARHARHIEAVIARGGRPAANGLVRHGPHGLQLELRLPDPAAPVRAPLPPAAPPAERPAERPVDAEFFPPERRTPPVPLLIGAGVLALLLVVGIVVGSRPGEQPTASTAARPSTSAVPTTTAAAPVTPPPPTSAVEQVRTQVPATTRAPRPTPRRTPVAPAPTAVVAPAPAPPPQPLPSPDAPAPIEPPAATPSAPPPPPECPDEQPRPLFGDADLPDDEECED